MSESIKLAVVASHPIQYWASAYRRLEQLKGVELMVFYAAENGAREYFDCEFNQYVKWDVPLTEGYSYHFLRPGHIIDRFSFWSVDAPVIKDRLEEFAPDYILVNGYGQLLSWRAMRFAKRAGARLIYISDSNFLQEQRGWKQTIKKYVLGYFFARVDFFLVTSPRNQQYLNFYGADSDKFLLAPLPTDIEWFAEQVLKVDEDDLDQLRHRHRIDKQQHVLLYVGKLISHKRPDDLVDALAQIKTRNVVTIIVGNGPLLKGLRKKVMQMGLESKVRFTGFVNQSSLAKYFVLGDIFVFPSEREPYGLIASEVLSAGLPIVAADNIGAVGAAIQPEVNALLYPSGDTNSLAGCIDQLLTNPQLLQDLSAGSKAISCDNGVSRLVEVVKGIINRKEI